MGDSPPWTPMNRRAKFDAANFILGGEIRNRTKNKRSKLQTVTNNPHLTYRHVWIKKLEYGSITKVAN